MSQSNDLFERACRVIPGGVNSPVRAFNSVGGDPVYVKSGKGSRITTSDGRELVDFCGSWGPLILGHARDEVVAAVQEAAATGMSFGINTEAEIELAELIHELIPYIEKSRLVSSGTEATMTALRLARGYTGRSKVIKFQGCYHGHSDAFLVAAGSGLLTGGISSSAGVPDDVVKDVILIPYNDLDAVKEAFAGVGDDIAAVIVEPVAGNMGLIMPEDGFLEGLRDCCTAAGAVLIFDEVINGFRLGAGSYGSICGVTPDLTCLGKIIGGGMPIGAVGGRAEVMDCLAPLGKVYQAGTLSGNPVAVAAGIKTLSLLRDDDPYAQLESGADRIREGVASAAANLDYPVHLVSLGGMFTLFFGEGPMRRLEDVESCDMDRFSRYFHHMLSEGIYISPSQYELCFISAAHTGADIDSYLSAFQSFKG